MDFLKLAQDRYSCKSFNGEKVKKEQLDAILEAGRLAPTAKNIQPQHVYVAESEEALAKIDKITPCRYNAGTCLVVTFDKNEVFVYPGESKNSGAEDASIAATQMMLCAASLGASSCWVNFFDPNEAAKILGLPENEEVVMILDLGYGAADAAPLPTHTASKSIDELVTVM